MGYDAYERKFGTDPSINKVDESIIREDDERQKRLAAELKYADEAQAAIVEDKKQQELAQQKLQQEAANSGIGGVAKNIAGGVQEVVTAGVGGAIDAVEQVGEKYNQPWMEFPDDWEPQNNSNWGKALRGLVTAAGPAIALAMLTRRGTAALGKSIGAAPPKWVTIAGNAGTDAAAGVAWDAIGKHAEDDNLTRLLKDNVPGLVGWVPDDWATLDSDSPDVKRKKNILEGAGLGLGIDIFQGGIELARMAKGLFPGVRFVPKDAQAAKNLDEIANKAGTNFSEHPVLDRLIKNDSYRQAADEEMALQRFAKNGMDDPDPFIHKPVFDDAERLTKAVRPDGVVQAITDNARIADNLGTVNGRMASFMTDAAIEGLEMTDLAGRSLVKKVEDIIKKSGNWEAQLPDGKKLGLKDILKKGDNLAATILDPSMTGDDLQQMFKSFDMQDFKTLDDGLKVGYINDAAYAGAFNAIKELKNYYLNMDTARASAYIQASLGGEIADTATAARVMGDTQDITRAQELILDKLKVLWYEADQSKAIAGWALNNKKVWQNIAKSGDANATKRFAKESVDSFKKGLTAKAEANASTLDELRAIAKENPEYLKPLLGAFELTDGDVNSIHTLTKYVQDNVLGIKKAFIDGQPEIPSQISRAMYGAFYNAKLSSLLTPIKALSNNFALLLMKPVNVMMGAALRGDGYTMHRAWVQYATHMDTTMKASSNYMSDMFKRVAADPEKASKIDIKDVTVREDLMKVARDFADAEASQGRYGAAMKVQFVDTMSAINNHPWVRYSMNTMEAGDAFVKSAVGMAEARGRAFDELMQQGRKITSEAVEEVSQKIYKEMFDDNGLITDKAVNYFSGEIAMNLDNAGVDAINEGIKRVPLLKTIIMFPRTSLNVLDFAHKHSPLSVFAGEIAAIRNLKEPTEIAEFLGRKGIEFSEEAWAHYKSEALGRVAMGTSLVTMGGWMWAQGNLTGNGHWDKQTNRFQQNAGDKPVRSWRGLDGKWRSYDGIDPIATFLGLTADILENHQTLGSADSEKQLQKLGFALSMNLTNKSFLQGLQPLSDLLSGQPAALSRYTSNLFSVGLFNQMSRIMTPGLREVGTDFESNLRNKWNILDVVGIGKPLPHAYDYVDGGKVNYEDPITNAMNNLLPFKTQSSPSPEKQFLIDSEFDVLPAFKTSLNGVKYDAVARSELARSMGEQGHFKRAIKEIMQRKDVQEELKNIELARAAGVTGDQAPLANSRTHYYLSQALYSSVALAKRQIAANNKELQDAEILGIKTKQAQQQGDYGTVLQLQNK